MDGSSQDKQDQRKNAGTEDSNEMTIEFLRARLLSERSISKSARHRADELAKRVFELEEQLKIVSLQRMKAEKATTDVLAILESNGISDVSEMYDSSSDQEGPDGYKVRKNESSRDEDNSVNSKLRTNESEEFSGSEFEFPPVAGRSLSWKGRSSHSSETYRDESMSRRRRFTSFSSSPRHHLGKSCRQIRRKESRSIREESKADCGRVNSDEVEVATPTTSEVCSNCSDVAPRDRKHSWDGKLSRSEINEPNGTAVKEMEKAIQSRALLIDQYEEMEKAQREWEEGFRENNNCTLDSYDPGNRSDVTEERCDITAEEAHPPDIITTSQTHDTASEIEDLSKNNQKNVQPSLHITTGQLQENNNRSLAATVSSNQDTSATGKDKINHESSRGHSHRDSVANLPSNISINSSRGTASGRQTEPSGELVAHGVPDELVSVLEALKQAKQSLHRNINRMQVVQHESTPRSVQHSVPTPMPAGKLDVPIESVGLFRVPSDFSPETNARGNTNTWLSLENTRPEHSQSYFETRSSLFLQDQFLASQHANGVLRLSPQMPYYDPRLSRLSPQEPYYDLYLPGGLPSSTRHSTPSPLSQKPYTDPYLVKSSPVSSRYGYTSSDTMSSPYHESMLQIRAREGSPRPEIMENTKDVLTRATGLPPLDHLSVPYDKIRPKMYNYK